MSNCKASYFICFISLLSVHNYLNAQNRYQYLFAPELDHTNKTVKEYVILQDDTLLNAIIEYDSFGRITNYTTKSPESDRVINYSNSEISITEFTRGKSITRTKLDIRKDSILIIETDADEVMHNSGVLLMDSLKNILVQMEGSDTLSTHFYDDDRFLRSTFYSKNNIQMVVYRTYFDENCYIEKAIDKDGLSMYNTLMNIDENTNVKIQEFRLADGIYHAQKYTVLKKSDTFEHFRFNQDTGLLEIFQMDSIFTNP